MTAGAIARWVATAGAAAAIIGIGLAAGGAQGPAPGSPLPSVADGGAPSATVKIVFTTVPPEKAVVSWGRKPIGIINRTPKRPLIIERPRDSGPLDVVVRAKNYLPVRTRAYTFTDSRVDVKLTLVEDKKTLFGYREELPDAGLSEAGRPGGADGGAPPAPPVGPPVGPPAPPVGPPAPPAGPTP
jgi:hypothetical protein